jgi:hypothetical protein
VIKTGTLAGRFVVPVVAYDGSAAGLSADGRTLVVIRPRATFPQSMTSLAIVDARALRVRFYLRLRGDFSFDAISTSGRWIYLIQYTSPADPTRYRVRALDAHTGRITPRDIVDPHDRGESMHGSPLTRIPSPDGRWAYTLYDGNGHPFVHALDTAGRRARCIDVPAFPASSNWYTARLRLSADGGRLFVTLGHKTLVAIDTRTFALSDRSRRAGRTRAGAGRADSGALSAAVPIAVAVAILLAIGALIIRRRPRGMPRPAGAP